MFHLIYVLNWFNHTAKDWNLKLGQFEVKLCYTFALQKANNQYFKIDMVHMNLGFKCLAQKFVGEKIPGI